MCMRSVAGPFGIAVVWDLIDRNPVEMAKPPRLNARVIHPLPTDESRVFQAKADTHPLKALRYVLLFTGMRRGEALGLQWDDVLDEMQQIRVRREIVKFKGRTSIHEYGKTDHLNRTIDCSEWLLSILAEHRVQQHNAQVQAGPLWEATRPWVFTSKIGTFLRPDSVYHTFKRLLAKAGLPSTTRVHDLRHGMATFWLSHGVVPQVVSERLGHASIDITLRIYGHVLRTMQAEAAEAMDALWRNPDSDPDPHP